MKNLTLENITKACGGKLYYAENADKSREALGVELDSRRIEDGYVFVATVGEKVDGHSFIGQVFDKGAMAVICEKLPEDNLGPCILVESSFDALRKLAAFYRSQISTKVVGITGSVGKTSTKEFIAGVLAQKYNVYKTAGNFNNTIGVPLTILRIRNEEIAVVEMGINQFGEMSLLTSIAKPDVAVITNIGDCHLEFLIDRDGVLRAKTEIFEGLSSDGNAVLNCDDNKLCTVQSVNGRKPVYFGIDNEDSEYKATEIVDRGLDGSKCVIKYGEEQFDANIPLPGKHMVYNALAATAVGKLFGLSNEEITAGLAGLQAVGGRSNVIRLGDMTIIDDCYNANPTSMKAAIDMLRNTEGQSVAILGDMYELGDDEASYHSEVGAYASMALIEKIVCIGELSKNMYEGAMKAKAANASYFATVEEALPELKNIISKGDIVLCKASHGMHFEKIVDFLKNSNEEA